MKILDTKCAQFGHDMAAQCEDETLINKCLGVLQEDGVYAFFLYLKSRSKTELKISEKISKKAYELLTQDYSFGRLKESNNDHLEFVRKKLGNRLDDLFFAKELLERALVYARYHAKALKAKKERKAEKTDKAERGA